MTYEDANGGEKLGYALQLIGGGRLQVAWCLLGRGATVATWAAVLDGGARRAAAEILGLWIAFAARRAADSNPRSTKLIGRSGAEADIKYECSRQPAGGVKMGSGGRKDGATKRTGCRKELRER